MGYARIIATLLLAAGLAGCDGMIDLSGVDWGFSGSGNGYSGPTYHSVTGRVNVGSFEAEYGEVRVFVYGPADPDTPLKRERIEPMPSPHGCTGHQWMTLDLGAPGSGS